MTEPRFCEHHWRPIETAPKEGSILLWTGNAEKPTMFWGAMREYGKHARPGWWIVTSGISVEPTHWQPLPAPPGELLPTKKEG